MFRLTALFCIHQEILLYSCEVWRLLLCLLNNVPRRSWDSCRVLFHPSPSSSTLYLPLPSITFLFFSSPSSFTLHLPLPFITHLFYPTPFSSTLHSPLPPFTFLFYPTPSYSTPHLPLLSPSNSFLHPSRFSSIHHPHLPPLNFLFYPTSHRSWCTPVGAVQSIKPTFTKHSGPTLETHWVSIGSVQITRWQEQGRARAASHCAQQLNPKW